MTYYVLIPDNVHQKALDILAQAEGIAVHALESPSREEVLAAAADADALIIRSRTQANAELLAAAPRLKIIARAGVGVDNVDLQEATRRGIVVMNTPGGNTVSSAEHTFGLMLALVRHLPQAHRSLAEGRWDKKLFMGTELQGKTLGIIGLGRVGQAVAKRAIAFGMVVLATDPYVDPHIATDIGAEIVDPDTLYARSDFISLHSTLTDETRGMICHESFNKMKPGVRIVNTARGALIVATDLSEAIQSGHVAGAALDVYDPEPPGVDHPLIGLPGVIHTPHLAASTTDAQIAVAVEAAQGIIAALLRGEYANVVNPEVLARQ